MKPYYRQLDDYFKQMQDLLEDSNALQFSRGDLHKLLYLGEMLVVTREGWQRKQKRPAIPEVKLKTNPAGSWGHKECIAPQDGLLECAQCQNQKTVREGQFIDRCDGCHASAGWYTYVPEGMKHLPKCGKGKHSFNLAETDPDYTWDGRCKWCWCEQYPDWF